MSAWHYLRRSLQHFRRIHLAVAAGVAVSTAVITGALLIGDSMRGSLRRLALEGLGRCDLMLLAEHPFQQSMLAQWQSPPAARGQLTAVVPLVLTQGSAAFRDDRGVRRASQLQVVGAPPDFWQLAPRRGASPVANPNTIALAAAVAEELGVTVGDAIVLRLPIVASVPIDSPLGEKEETAASRRLRVSAIFAPDDAGSFARFSLRPSQQAPRNAFVPLETIQQMLKLDGRANAAAIAVDGSEAFDGGDLAGLRRSLRPDLSNYGVSVERVDVAGGAEGRSYIHIAADRQVLPPSLVAVASELYADQGLQPVVTYLANTMVAGKRKIPYSTIAGADSTAELGPLLDDAGKPVLLARHEIALNDWAAEQLNVRVGDSVTITWYEPETIHGQLREAPPLALKVRAIVPLADAAARPTWAADPRFAPELPGVTDQASINDWDLPFELTETIREEDEQYWDAHRTTPKAFVAYELASQLWSTRWGTDSVLRLPAAEHRTAESVARELRGQLDPQSLGLQLVAAKQNALAAASGTTPFDGLFLGFSFFLMASAVMLTTLLFRLGVDQRAREVGLLLAVGLPVADVRRLLTAEAGIVATAGAAAGAGLGIAYARLLVYGLNTWWVDATAAPFMTLHVTPQSIVIGFVAGIAVALATIAYSLRRLSRLPARQLLGGDAQPPLVAKTASRLVRTYLPLACLILAVAAGVAASRLEAQSQAIAFLGGGALVLTGVLLAISGKLREPIIRPPGAFSLAGLAARNGRRHPSRTMLSLGLAATSSFLIVALSAFRLAPTDGGVGGFDLLATADLPVLYDLGSEPGRRELGFSDEENKLLAGLEVVSFRVHDGEDASCLNLYQTTQPRILGAPAEIAQQSDFLWAATRQSPSPPSPAAETPAEAETTSTGASAAAVARPRGGAVTGWSLLRADLGRDENGRRLVPAVLDRNTAAYSLKLGLGDRLAVGGGASGARLQIVGLLANSVLQGDVIISEAEFRRLFPEEAGRRFFLLRRGPHTPPIEQLASLLETRLEDYGFDAVDARDRLGALLAVQNTYLSTFQSLGGLGMLLGVVGLALAQLRSVLERRGELALLQSVGFRRRRLAWMVLAENLVLLLGGLGVGCLAALAVVLPHALSSQASAPWATLALMLAIIVASGAIAGWAASRSVLRAPLLPALRGD
ncbi:MAG: hypothetical protein DCC67_04175 [Planctomycetota bacterium]|nr:MAG: hypothetical protein DCC67_04175 [Planctomycetota bacterium]